MTQIVVDRASLAQAPIVVVKIGSSSLTGDDHMLNETLLDELVDVLIECHERGQKVVLVSSGAVAAGLPPLGFASRPKNVRDQQAAAMIGQARLMQAYAQRFAKANITVAQVLLTPDDVVDRRHYSNAQAALRRLLRYGVIPIVNENDAVVTDDLRFGDNDRLAALVSHLVKASVLVLCTDVAGLYTAPPSRPGAELIREVTSPEQLRNLTITGKGSDVGTGGMRTKVTAADIATSGGVATLLVDARQVREAFTTGEVGTWFAPVGKRTSARDLWLRYSAVAKGAVIVDEGAARAVRTRRASLLAVGIVDCEGDFSAGDLLDVRDESGAHVAQGLSAFSSFEIRGFLDSARDSGARRAGRPVIHVDDLVV